MRAFFVLAEPAMLAANTGEHRSSDAADAPESTRICGKLRWRSRRSPSRKAGRQRAAGCQSRQHDHAIPAPVPKRRLPSPAGRHPQNTTRQGIQATARGRVDAVDDGLVGDQGRLNAEVEADGGHHDQTQLGLRWHHTTNPRAAKDTVVRGRTEEVTRSGPRRSASRPAKGAASAPAAPARPNAPAAALPSPKLACSMTASVDQNALKATDNRPWETAARRGRMLRPEPEHGAEQGAVAQ